ncbi:MAG: NDP-sugar synthase, partial [Acidobacteria bacterium]|nr:NDP-sugar synthase [Acidobacteriota bacterium]
SGALDNARTLLEGGTFVVINGKLATDINLKEAFETHRRTDALVTLVLRRNVEREKYSGVLTRDGLVLGFGPASPASDNACGARRAALDEKEAVESEAGGAHAESVKKDSVSGVMRGGDGGTLEDDSDIPLMFTGIQIVEPEIFSYIPHGVFSHTTADVYPHAISRGERIAAHVAKGAWYELSTVRRYLDTSLALLKREGRGVEMGAGTVIDACADVHDSVLWEDVRVETGARVRHAILGAGVVVPSGEIIESAAVVRAELLTGAERPPKGLKGEVRGANFVAPLPQ